MPWTKRAITRARFAACAAALLVVSPGLRAEDTAALLARAPALPLDAPVTPLAAPVEIATQGWGPFRLLCVHRGTIQPGTATEAAPSPPFCLTVEAANEEGGTWRLSLRTVPRGPTPAIAFGTTRDARGAVGPVSIAIPEGAPAPPEQQLALLRAVFRATLHANGMERATVSSDAPFILPLALDAAAPELRVEGGGFACRAEGRTRLQDRDAVVATCTGRAAGRVGSSRAMTVDMAGRFAIDIATGMVLRHGYASFLLLERSTPGEAPMELRGTSRLVLE